MNYKLSKEIYGLPWSVDALSFMHLSSMLKNMQNGVKLEIPDVKLNSISLLQFKNDTRIINNNYDLTNSDSFEGIGIINLNGPIIRNGGASTNGTKDLSSQMLYMSRDPRIKGFIISTDSGGGASAAVQIMVDAINEVKQTVPVYALVEKGGMAGSAAYGIISAATGIYSEDGMNIVGSVGTMIQFSGKAHGNVDAAGEKTIALYATKSTSKNKAFEEAINNDNYDLLISELLDPINESFINSVITNRPQLQGSNFDDGHTVFSKDAIGTFIDGIASFEEVVSMILTSNNNNSNNNSNSNKMTKTEIKNDHPAVYSEIMAEGVASEQERVNSWMAYKDIDSKSVDAGIASGLQISQSQSHAFLVKATMGKGIADLQADNAIALSTGETKTNGKIDPNAAAKAELDSAFDFKL